MGTERMELEAYATMNWRSLDEVFRFASSIEQAARMPTSDIVIYWWNNRYYICSETMWNYLRPNLKLKVVMKLSRR